MNLWRGALPWWFLLAAIALIAAPVLVEVYLHLRFSSFLTFLVFAVFFLFATDAILSPVRRRLTQLLAPAPVFATEHDSGSRAHLEALAGARITGSWSLLAIQPEGLEVWTIDRQPKREGLAPWSRFAGATAAANAPRWRSGTVEVLLPDGRALYLDVRVSVIDRFRRSGPNASQLALALTQHLTPAQPDPAHRPPRAQTG